MLGKVVSVSTQDLRELHSYTQKAKASHAITYSLGVASLPTHLSRLCRYKMVDCHYCVKQGHIQDMCRSKRAGVGSDRQRQNYHTVAEESSKEEPDTLHALNSSANGPIVVELQIDDHPVRMEVDTGASWTVIGETRYGAGTSPSSGRQTPIS